MILSKIRNMFMCWPNLCLYESLSRYSITCMCISSLTNVHQVTRDDILFFFFVSFIISAWLSVFDDLFESERSAFLYVKFKSVTEKIRRRFKKNTFEFLLKILDFVSDNVCIFVYVCVRVIWIFFSLKNTYDYDRKQESKWKLIRRKN